MISSLSVIIPFLSLACAATIHGRDAAIQLARDSAHEHSAPSLLPGRWYHESNHPAHALFRRQTANTTATNDGFPQVGTPTWSAAYPSDTPDSSKMPQAWIDALNAAVKAGQIPNIPPSTQSNPDANPTYGNLDPNGPEVCSGTYQCRIAGQIWDAPAGVLGLSFDDGPLPTSDALYTFLQQNQLHATHFFIGTNILQNSKEFLTAFETNQDDIAVHTWTHPYMTTLSNEDVVAQFGWTMQLIYNSTGGRLAKYWRPPYGDTDTRVTAIAKEVFGLTTVVWNQDTNDWSLGESGGTNAAAIQANFKKWLSGPKTPGLIILEHELSTGSVQAFKDGYPLMTQNNWTITSVARIQGNGSYQNSQDSTSPVISAGLLAGGNNGAGLLAATSSSSAPASSQSTKPSPSSGSGAGNNNAGANSQTKSNGSVVVRSPTFALVASVFGLLLGLCAV